MKKILAIVLALTLALSTSVVVYAHTWPENPGNWTKEDWDAWNNYWKDYWKNYNYWNQCPSANPYYNGNCNGYYTNTNTPGNGYNNSYDYKSYNYYGGVLDVYQPETEDQAVILAKIIYLYGHGVASQTQQAAIGWSVLNSVDDSGSGNNIGTVASNFHYDASKPTRDDFGRDLMPLARDVIFRWKAGRAGVIGNGRVLPNSYDYVWSTGNAVVFRNTPDESGRAWSFDARSTPYAN